MSDRIPRFAAYAAAFEEAVASDDWKSLEPFFTDDVHYEIGLGLLGAERCQGRDRLFEWFRSVFEGFDRRFESRELKLLEGPVQRANEVWIRGSAIYRATGVPDFVLTLEEVVRFEGDRIAFLEDRYSDDMIAESERFLADYGEALGIRTP